MAQAYSQDLRERVIDAGTSARQAAERFGIGVATAIVWVRRAREGERSARKQGQRRRYRAGSISVSGVEELATMAAASTKAP